ncbi:hypothetical protein PLESTF_000015500 [Pleodorina starrii]|nr:hypothetical protein PLESTM_000218000 [Pleodorina starrii]GLC63242.1 hypothetical protein PLESTF_000015500 [Pleodorina starrii]
MSCLPVTLPSTPTSARASTLVLWLLNRGYPDAAIESIQPLLRGLSQLAAPLFTAFIADATPPAGQPQPQPQLICPGPNRFLPTLSAAADMAAAGDQ